MRLFQSKQNQIQVGHSFTKLAFLSLLALSVAQPVVADDLSYKTVSASYQEVDVALFGDQLEFSGYELTGQYLLDDHMFLFGRTFEWTNSDFSFEPEITALEVGIGAKTRIARRTDFFGGIAYGTYTLKFGNLLDRDASGFSLLTGIRGLATEKLELEASLNSTHADSNTDTQVNFVARYLGFDFIQPQLKISTADESDAIGLGVRLAF